MAFAQHTTNRPLAARAALLGTALLGAACCGLVGCNALDEVPAGSQSLLAGFQPPTPQEAAAMATDEFNSDQRFRGIQLLSYAPWGGDDVYRRLYLDRLSDQDSGVRWAATRAIGRHGSPEHVEAIVPMLADESADVRAEAARALQRIHSLDAITALIRMLSPDVEREPRVRAEAARALGQYAEPRVVQALIASFEDRHLVVNEAALTSLRTLTGQDFGFDSKLWVSWVEQTPDVFAARQPYEYPVFNRDRRLVEYLPFVPPPPNEASSTPVGMPPLTGG